MPRCLVTGVNGLLGSHLAQLLLANDAEVVGTYHRDRQHVRKLEPRLTLASCDLLERGQVEEIVRLARWDFIFHFAGQSYPSLSWSDPETTFRINLLGTLHLLESIRKSGLPARVVIAGSSAEYSGAGQDETPILETAPLAGSSPYGVAKLAGELLANLYAKAYGSEIVVVRPFFVVGPGKAGDVCSDFARGIVAVERGQQSSLPVGNLDAVRDFLDVRDAVRACWLLGQTGQSGQAYNLCSGTGIEVRELLRILCSFAAVPIEVKEDSSRVRAIDAPSVVGDNTRLRALGWRPQISIEQTLSDILAYWRHADRE
jgi:GDP-4-dehydro-6-deoxy-D-mannose reductase